MEKTWAYREQELREKIVKEIREHFPKNEVIYETDYEIVDICAWVAEGKPVKEQEEVCDCPESGVYFMECDICRGQK